MHVLEIGAGNGSFVRRVKEELAPANIRCTEFSGYGQESIRKLGIQVDSKDIREMTTDDFGCRFDFICLFQVLEHLSCIDELFEKLNSLAHPEYDLLVSVPNEKVIDFYERNGGLLDMPPNHVSRWNRNCFEQLGKRHNLQLITHQYEPVRFFSDRFKFIKYCHHRIAQQSGSWRNRIETKYSGLARNLLRCASLVQLSLKHVKSMLWFDSKLGTSQWVHFRRIA